MKLIGCDLDGVCSNFVKAFFKISNRRFGTSYTVQEDWDFTQYTKAEVSAVWEEIKATKNFWQTLDPEAGVSRLRYALPKNVEPVFITSRIPTLGHGVREQSCQWLREHFGITHPFVIVADNPANKIPIVKALDIQTFIDDKRSTIEEMNTAGLRSYARLQPYNCKTPFPEGVVPVEDLNEFLKLELNETAGQ